MDEENEDGIADLTGDMGFQFPACLFTQFHEF